MDIKEKLAKELYDWAGRFGGHQGVLWEQATETVRHEYLAESEFIQKEFGVALLEPPADKVEAVASLVAQLSNMNVSDHHLLLKIAGKYDDRELLDTAREICRAFVVKLPKLKRLYYENEAGFDPSWVEEAVQQDVYRAIRQDNPGVVFKEE